jgi:hypothetical protein
MRVFMENGCSRELVAKKAPPGEAKSAGLARIPITRQESRKTNQRREDRYVNLAERAVITFRRKRIEVDVVNVSSHGVMMESDIEPRLGERIEVQFEDCNRALCSVRWVKGRRVGLEFASETVLVASAEVHELIAGGRREGEHPPRLELRPERPLRHTLLWTGVLHHGVESADVRLRNVSAAGAMLDCDQDFLVGTVVVLEVPGTCVNAAQGRVRWCRSGQIGVLFDAPLDMRLLAEPPAAQAPVEGVRRYIKPDYLATDGSPDSPWAARTCGLRHEDL